MREGWDKKVGMDWEQLSTIHTKRESIGEEELDRTLTALLAPLSTEEKWEYGLYHKELVLRTLPEAYLSFLRWSNGGEFSRGERHICFSPVWMLREGAVGCAFGGYMPEVLPFADDLGDTRYMFDMRNPAVHGEYPILVTEAGNASFETSAIIATTFVELCSDDRASVSLLGY